MFLTNLREELQRADEFLDADLQKEFTGYYRIFTRQLTDPRRFDMIVRGLLRGDTSYVLDRCVQRNGSPQLKILDIGSGLGTQSLLFGFLGHSVVSIDLRTKRHQVAVRRKRFYEQELGRTLDIDFRLMNIFHLDALDGYDLIWISNAISHIHPVEGLLQHCYRLLRNRGEVVIVDLNGMNPMKRLQTFRERGLRVYTTRKDPNTNQDVIYANERILSVSRQCRLLKQAGFTIAYYECYLGLHSKVGDRIYPILKRINQTKLVSSFLGSRYLVVGRKP